jgi:hypothetical protein
MPSIIIYTNKLLLHNPLKFKMIFLYKNGLRSEEVIKIGNR